MTPAVLGRCVAPSLPTDACILTALEIVERSAEQIVFAPRLVMKPGVKGHGLREIRVAGWGRVERPVYLSVRSDLVSKRLEANLSDVLARRLV